MLFQRLRRRLRSQQTRLAIQPQRPWWWRWAGSALMVAGSTLVILGSLHWYSAAWLAPLQLQSQNHVLSAEVERLGQDLKRAQQAQAMLEQTRSEDRAARDSLAQDLANLREENLHLKEDLASLRSLMAPSNGEGVRLSGFRVRPGTAPGEYRWHLLLAQGGRQSQDFRGRVRLRLEYAPGEPREPQYVVSGDPKDGTQDLSFKYYQELEGSFRTTTGQHLRKVWAEVWRNGEPQPALVQPFTLP